MTADIFERAEQICIHNEAALARLEQARRGHLLFLMLAPLLPAVLGAGALWFFLLRFDNDGPAFMFAPLVFAGAYFGFLLFAYPVFDSDYRKKAKQAFMELMSGSLGLRYRRGGVMRLGDLYDPISCRPMVRTRSRKVLPPAIKPLPRSFRISESHRKHSFSRLIIGRFCLCLACAEL
ncbi:MAG: hypothetical protein KDJ75_04475 [Alphaproteobacteria bacterium]|nr:hypothetical protein [Alphaproteobacteria bacterium]